jgi:hypothetical protein
VALSISLKVEVCGVFYPCGSGAYCLGDGSADPYKRAVDVDIIIFLALSSFSIFAWVYSIRDAFTSPDLTQNQKIFWLLIIAFVQPIGMLLYWMISPGQKRRNQAGGRLIPLWK